jgi:hypothetical protein
MSVLFSVDLRSDVSSQMSKSSSIIFCSRSFYIFFFLAKRKANRVSKKNLIAERRI